MQGGQIKRGEMGIAGAIIVISQVLSQFQITRNTGKEVDELKQEFRQVKIDQEKYFVKKEEMRLVVNKLEQMASELASMTREIKSIREDGFLTLDLDHPGDVIGCSDTERIAGI